MHVIHPGTYQRHEKPRRHYRWLYALVLLVLAAGIINYARPLATSNVVFQMPPLPAPHTPSLAWPASGQAAIGADGYGVLASYGNQAPIATASIAKVITALCVLQKSPLDSGQNGPTYTINQADLTIYTNYLTEDASLVPVAPGETLSERQALEALMIPSANNIADSLAGWVFTNQADYAAFANQFLLQHGITHTHIGTDASGFDPSTTSTASDLVQIGLLALRNPTLMAIAGQQSADLPVVGTVYNYDTVLGQNGITGLKTGNSNDDPGAFLYTAETRVGERTVRTVGAVLGQSSLNQALSVAVNLAGTAANGFTTETLVPKGRPVGHVRTAWGTTTEVVTSRDVAFTRWIGTPLAERHMLHATTGQKGTVGALEVTSDETGADTPLTIVHEAKRPSFWWRLSRH